MAKNAANASKTPQQSAADTAAPRRTSSLAGSGGDGSAASPGRQPNPGYSDSSNQTLECGLYVVATPIGNLDDITLRALTTLKSADRIACEDTRVTGKLLNHFKIQTPMWSYNDHNGPKVRPRLLKDLEDGKAVALVSDAGTPLISDPGLKLVQACIDNNIKVIPVPGASAVLAGLVTSGLPTDRIMFVGFLPAKTKARQTTLQELASLQATLVFYESGPRLAKSLDDMARVLGPRPAVVARELTKRYEEVIRHPLDQLAETVGDQPAPKGELVVLVSPPGPAAGATDVDVDDALVEALKTKSVRDAANEIAALTGRSKRDIYARALALAQSQSDGTRP